MSTNRLTASPSPVPKHCRTHGHTASNRSISLLADCPQHTSAVRRDANHQQTGIRSILVPLDGTEFGERALPLATNIAKQAGAQLQLLHVYTPLQGEFFPATYSGGDGDMYRQQVDYLWRVSRQVGDVAKVTVISKCIRQRDTVAGICQATDDGVDLIVAATHGYGRFERFWQGGILHKLIDRVKPPILVVRGDNLRASLAPDRWLRRVLVPLNGMKPAESIVDPAIALGSPYQADYSLLTVMPSASPARPSRKPDNTWEKQLAVQRYLNRVVNRLRQRSQKSLAHISMTDELVAKAIVKRAEECDADCIAMASEERRGLQRWLRPSITQRVIQLSPVPVLVRRPFMR